MKYEWHSYTVWQQKCLPAHFTQPDRQIQEYVSGIQVCTAGMSSAGGYAGNAVICKFFLFSVLTACPESARLNWWCIQAVVSFSFFFFFGKPALVIRPGLLMTFGMFYKVLPHDTVHTVWGVPYSENSLDESVAMVSLKRSHQTHQPPIAEDGL